MTFAFQIRDVCSFEDIGQPRFHAKLFKYI